MAENIITPEFKGCFVRLFKASGMKQADGSVGEAKYSIKAAFPPIADLSLLKNEVSKAAKEKWSDKLPKILRSPFRINGDLDTPIEGIGDDWTVVTFSAKENSRPGLVDANVQDIIDESEVYSGAWYIAQVRAYAYDMVGNKGVAFGLQNVQKLRDDAPLGAGKVPASKVFSPVSGNTAADIFG